MNNILTKFSPALILAGVMGAGVAVAAGDLEVTMDVLSAGEALKNPVGQATVAPVAEREQVRETRRVENRSGNGDQVRERDQVSAQEQGIAGDDDPVREQARHQHRNTDSGDVGEPRQLREQSGDMRGDVRQESQEVRQETRERSREMREEAQQQVMQMREETEPLRQQARDMQKDGGR